MGLVTGLRRGGMKACDVAGGATKVCIFDSPGDHTLSEWAYYVNHAIIVKEASTLRD